MKTAILTITALALVLTACLSDVELKEQQQRDPVVQCETVCVARGYDDGIYGYATPRYPSRCVCTNWSNGATQEAWS